MKILIACEYTGATRDAFAARGHDAWSCDLKPAETPGDHLREDARTAFGRGPWDLIIAHPPCTHLAVSGAAWFKNKPKRQRRALEFFLACLNAPAHSVCVENPVCVASTEIRKPDQIIQPYWFGDEAQKTTCLWLRNLPPLKPTKIVGKGRIATQADGRKYPEWMYDKALRDRTFPGIANAMADQWGRPHTTGFGLYFPHQLRRKK